VPDGFKMKRE